MAANQKLRRENLLLVPPGTGYFLKGEIGISPQNQALFHIDRYFVGFRETRLIFGAGLST
ncbi:hypothetical protein [Pseudomonas sp. 6D_7.1_Bac1]|uniref:hypothetical protein n=1 Tax=Pseudomonas sp. 6D_7.1_Bac1 TaxID=2971615 RepID=UPI0021C5CCC2|nr:hypothetical protein [Pseudomonas sp. 6D_7.1_Bac1]MCU1748953.1 hypothetical protein [Pseudomonas sp. 6D_7.1_Bac1]